MKSSSGAKVTEGERGAGEQEKGSDREGERGRRQAEL